MKDWAKGGARGIELLKNNKQEKVEVCLVEKDITNTKTKNIIFNIYYLTNIDNYILLIIAVFSLKKKTSEILNDSEVKF